jgi:hypothetical protein
MDKFKLIKDEDINKNEVKHVKIYESEYYKLRIFYYNSGYISIDVFRSENNTFEFLPSLYIKEDDNFKVKDIEIETTAYGSMDCKKIEKVIQGYNIALESVKELKRILRDNELY